MHDKLLILGGTREASALANAVACLDVSATLSYAGRVQRPRPQPIKHRVGGFGGIDGLADYLKANNITHVVDATHPFAAQMSRHAVAACQVAGVALIALTRPAWQPQKGDDWQCVADIDGAVRALDGRARRVLLAIGRLNLDRFAGQGQHHYVLRLVDRPGEPPPLPHHSVIVARGPFTLAGDLAVMREYDIEVIVAKNAGGDGAVAKLQAARELGLRVIMIERPQLPQRREVTSVGEVLRLLGHDGADPDADLGVNSDAGSVDERGV